MMRPVATAAALVVALLPLSATAQDVTLSYGAALSTDYLVSGISQTGGRPVFQPYVEVGVGGFYAGAWASNVRLGRDRTEVDLYAGFRNSVGALDYDVGYARYFYNRSGNCCGEVLVSLGYAAPYGMTFLGDAAYDPDAEILTASAGAAYTYPAGWSVSAEAGRVEQSHNFWNLGVGMAVNPVTTLDLRVHDTNITSARVVGTVSFDF